jgi:hypothetical protein
LRRLGAWWRRNWENVLLAAIGAALFAGVASIGGLIKEVNLNDKLSLWVALAILIVAGGVGAAGALLTTRKYYRAQLRAPQLERDQALEQLESVRPDFEALKRLGVYTDHFQNVMESVLFGELTLQGFPKDKDSRIEAAFCRMPHEHIATAAGQDVRFSIWAEAKGRIKRGRFEVIFSNHEQQEAERFGVVIANTWLHHAAEYLGNHPDSTRLHRIDDLSIAGLFGDDIEVFRELGYGSVRAISFECDGRLFRLVALSRSDRAFSPVEDRYLLLLWAALAVAASRTQPSQ